MVVGEGGRGTVAAKATGIAMLRVVAMVYSMKGVGVVPG
jgi:hypothetical protein